MPEKNKTIKSENEVDSLSTKPKKLSDDELMSVTGGQIVANEEAMAVTTSKAKEVKSIVDQVAEAERQRILEQFLAGSYNNKTPI